MPKSGDIEVDELSRTVYFSGGRRQKFIGVSMFNSEGSFLRIECESHGYVLINTANIDFIEVDGERVR